MSLSRTLRPLSKAVFMQGSTSLQSSLRNITTTETGSVLPMPHKTRFGLIGIVLTVVPGLLIGAKISKKMANFLEENELFVPSDDDDDDD